MGIRGWHVFWNPGGQRIIKEEKKMSRMRRGREKNAHWMKVKPSNCNDTKSEKMGYPKLGFTKWQEEDKKLNIKQHYLLMQQQAGRIVSESPVDLTGGGRFIKHGGASHSSVHSAGTSLRQRWCVLPAGGQRELSPCLCVSLSGDQD